MTVETDIPDIAAMLAETGGLSAEEVLAWAYRRFGSRVAFASSLGAEDQALTDMLSRAAPKLAVFTLDTGRLPQDTYDVLAATRERYGLRIEVMFPQASDVEEMTTSRGPNSFRASVEDRRLCCHVRKVLPLRRRLAGLDAWVTGLRRDQAATRTLLASVEWDAANGLLKINPLADWSAEEVWTYIRRNDVPVSALHERGYPSIGCEPCTRAVAAGEDIRAGRWWWESPQHKECGLHMEDGRLVPGKGAGQEQGR
jgi:phosphoadenosine phosphosulfate reductase